MGKTSIFTTSVVIFVAVTSLCFAETIGERSLSFLVKYSDGTGERYLAKYYGTLNVNHSESGGPWTWDHPYDDRQCHWSIQTLIQREMCLVSKTGQQFCVGKMNRVYGTSFANEGSGFKVTSLAPENCGAAQARFESDVNNARNALSSALQTAVDQDRQPAINDLKTTLTAAEVVPQ